MNASDMRAIAVSATFAIAAVSSNARHTVVPATLHEIHLSAPLSVIQAIDDVCDAVRMQARLRARP